MIIGERISERLESLGITQAELARRVGVTPQAVSKMVKGLTTDSPKLYQIAKILCTTPEYLTGEARVPTLPDAEPPRLDVRPKPATENPDVVELDEIDLRYGMGGSYIDGPVSAAKRQFSREWLRQITRTAPEHLFWATGDGDSMEPTIRTQDIILIDRSQTSLRMGDGVWAIAWGDVGMIKRLRPLPDGTLELHSDNPLVRPATAVDGEVHIIGRVVAVVKRL